VVSALLAAAALFGSAQSACAATTVRYAQSKHPTLHDTPWVLARPQSAAVVGHLLSYTVALRDGRVNLRDGLVLWRTGARIVWNVSGTVAARRLGVRASFRRDVTRDVVSEFRFPSPGCWQLRLRGTTVIARVIEPRPLACDASPVESAGVFARPRSSGIRGGWGPWRTPQGGASIYTHGHHAGMNMKVPWWVRRAWGPTLTLTGIRLDAEGNFRQEFPMALSPRGVFPSIIDVPAAGCWLFRLRTGRLAGVLVVRAIDR
jgi:hypothetical protein